MNETTVDQPVIAFKGFDKDLVCNPNGGERTQYVIGQTLEIDGEIETCKRGFHACEYPLHVLRYYAPATSRFAVVEQSGQISRHEEDSKIASSRITIKAEIDIAGLVKAAVKYTMDRCTPAAGANTDLPNTSVSANGSNKSATASGDSGAATASGRNGKAKGKQGCALFLVYRDSNWKIVHAKAAIVGQDGIKADTWYSIDASGNFVEV